MCSGAKLRERRHRWKWRFSGSHKPQKLSYNLKLYESSLGQGWKVWLLFIWPNLTCPLKSFEKPAPSYRQIYLAAIHFSITVALELPKVAWGLLPSKLTPNWPCWRNIQYIVYCWHQNKASRWSWTLDQFRWVQPASHTHHKHKQYRQSTPARVQ